MECKKCKRECLESELKNGYCLDCFNKYAGDITKLKNANNTIANYFKVCTTVAVIFGILLGIVAFFANYGFFIALSCIFISVILAAFLRAIAEIIQLLEDIKNK